MRNPLLSKRSAQALLSTVLALSAFGPLCAQDVVGRTGVAPVAIPIVALPAGIAAGNPALPVLPTAMIAPLASPNRLSVAPALPAAIAAPAPGDKPASAAANDANTPAPPADARGRLESGVAAISNASAASPAASSVELGALTRGLLEKFFENGPTAEERGDRFLLAEGAKALPPGLESSRNKRRQPALRGTATNGMLFRKGGKPFVRFSDLDGRSNVYPVAWQLAQGIVSDTVVSVSFNQKSISEVKSIGAYPADMVVGRVARVGQDLVLKTLLHDGNIPLSLYGPMPLESGSDAKDGDIVQAFVRPSGEGYSAVSLANLGRDITPEVAAAEAAFRHGARGYFDEAVIRQAEEIGRTQDVARDFAAMQKAGVPIKDMRDLPFITVDPKGASDLDDAFHIVKHKDGSFTWYLATANVAHSIKPGSPAFKAAARIGNTFYTIDSKGVPAYPMNHPVISKYGASLIAGKDSLAIITKMEFSKDGEFLRDQSEVSLGIVHAQGRYSYDQVTALWQGATDHGIAQVQEVMLARELAAMLNRKDAQRGKLQFRFSSTQYEPQADGSWTVKKVDEDPLAIESHGLIEELKVYGNQVLATMLTTITEKFGVPHISRVHPAQKEEKNEKLRQELQGLGVEWKENQPLGEFLKDVQGRTDLTPETIETIQIMALRTRQTAIYAMTDDAGHEGLALEANQYDHPSAPIRRFSDMYNVTLIEAFLRGENPQTVYHAILKDLKELGFSGLAEYLDHLNGRQKANKQQQRREIGDFMSVYELSKPQYHNKSFTGQVIFVRKGRETEAEIRFKELPVSIRLQGREVGDLEMLDNVMVTVYGADVSHLKVDTLIVKLDDEPSAAGKLRDDRRDDERRASQPQRNKKDRRRRR